MADRGYPKLAVLMSLHSETAVFKRFGSLNMLNLLRLQAELQDMESELAQIQEDDEKSGDDVRKKYVTDFRLMRDFKDVGDSEQLDLLGEIGKKLEEYSKAGGKPSKHY